MKKQENNFDFIGTSIQIQLRMAEYHLKSAWLLDQIRQTGMKMDDATLSRILRNVLQNDRAKRILEISGEILDDYEKYFVNRKEFAQSFCAHCSDKGTYSGERIRSICPAQGKGESGFNETHVEICHARGNPHTDTETGRRGSAHILRTYADYMHKEERRQYLIGELMGYLKSPSDFAV